MLPGTNRRCIARTPSGAQCRRPGYVRANRSIADYCRSHEPRKPYAPAPPRCPDCSSTYSADRACDCHDEPERAAAMLRAAARLEYDD
jgi:hypothetical protein